MVGVGVGKMMLQRHEPRKENSLQEGRKAVKRIVPSSLPREHSPAATVISAL